MPNAPRAWWNVGGYVPGAVPGGPMPYSGPISVGTAAAPAQGGIAGILAGVLATAGAAAKGANEPDLMDPNGQTARLQARMRLLATDGLMQTFTSGLRGAGGPGLAASTAAADPTKWEAATQPGGPSYAGPVAPGPDKHPITPPPGKGLVGDPASDISNVLGTRGPRPRGGKGWWQTPDDLRAGVLP